MKISIVIATYNGGAHIGKQLQSIKEQSKLPDEIIISDDCSRDNTITIINNFTKKNKLNIKLFKNYERKGSTQNFNNAILKATGDIIFLCDQDDFWFNKKIETIVELAKKNPSHNLFINEVELTDENLIPSGKTKLDKLRENGLGLMEHGMGCATAIRKKFVDLILPIPSNIMGHDNWINTISDIVYDRYYHPEVLQYYRRHANVTSKINSNFIGKKFNFFSLIVKIFEYKKWLEGLKSQSIMDDLIFKIIEEKFDALKLIGDKTRIIKFLTENQFKREKLEQLQAKRFKGLHLFIFSIVWTFYYSNPSESNFRPFSMFIKNYFMMSLRK